MNRVMVFEWATQPPYDGGNVIFIETYRGYDIYFLDHVGLQFYGFVDPDGVEANIFHSLLSGIKTYIDGLIGELEYPKADLLTAIGPDSATAGESIILGMQVKNVGAVAGQIWTQIYDGDTGDLVRMYTRYSVAPGEVFEWPTYLFTMPYKDWNLVYRVGHFENSTMIEDERIIKTILLVAAGIPTTTTLTVPDSVNPEELFDVVTKLTTEAGVPLAGMEMVLTVPEIPEIILRAYTWTDGTCEFMLSLPQGTYTIRADFFGTAALQASTSINPITSTTPIIEAL
ncbi:hypothetical protein ES703_116548 [subsurface metagenome]